MTDLVLGRDPCLAGRSFRDQQRADRLHVAVRRLRDPTSSVALRRPHRLDRVDRIGLALQTSSLPVRAIDLDHLDTLAAQQPRQPRAIGASALNSNTRQLAEARQPLEQLSVARRSRFERLDTEHPADRIQRRRDMCIEVRVTPPVIGRVSTMVIAIPSLLKRSRGGTHVPGRRPCRARCANSELGHPLERGVPRPRTGRQAPDRTRCCEPSQTDTGPLNVTAPDTQR